MNLKKGTLDVGADGDVTVFDPEREWTFQHASSLSKSSNSPFEGWRLKGQAILTIVAGRTVEVSQDQSAVLL